MKHGKAKLYLRCSAVSADPRGDQADRVCLTAVSKAEDSLPFPCDLHDMLTHDSCFPAAAAAAATSACVYSLFCATPSLPVEQAACLCPEIGFRTISKLSACFPFSARLPSCPLGCHGEMTRPHSVAPQTFSRKLQLLLTLRGYDPKKVGGLIPGVGNLWTTRHSCSTLVTGPIHWGWWEF